MDAELTETSHRHSLLTQLVGPVLDSALTLESGRHGRKSPSLGHFPSCTMSSVASPLHFMSLPAKLVIFPAALKKHPMGR